MSNAELALLLFIILTVGHYAVVWSIYLEKQLDELLSRKKREKKKKTGGRSTDEAKLAAALDKNERVLDKPQWHDLLPCKLGIWFCLTVKALPQLFQDARQLYVEYKETKMKAKKMPWLRLNLKHFRKRRSLKSRNQNQNSLYTQLWSQVCIYHLMIMELRLKRLRSRWMIGWEAGTEPRKRRHLNGQRRT